MNEHSKKQKKNYEKPCHIAKTEETIPLPPFSPLLLQTSHHGTTARAPPSPSILVSVLFHLNRGGNPK